MKYKNTSGFRQTIIVSGKKTIVFADDVIEVEHELFNAAFEKMPDDAETTHKERAIRRPGQSTQHLTHIEDQLKEVKKDAEAITEIASQKTHQDIADVRKELADFKGLVIKRLEILKTAVQSLEYELEQVLYDEEDQAKPFRKG